MFVFSGNGVGTKNSALIEQRRSRSMIHRLISNVHPPESVLSGSLNHEFSHLTTLVFSSKSCDKIVDCAIREILKGPQRREGVNIPKFADITLPKSEYNKLIV